MPLKNLSFAIVASVGYVTSVNSAPLIFNNVQDFEGQAFKHISFDPPDERTSTDIVKKFDNISSFSMSSDIRIRHISSPSGFDGGAVSGEYYIYWGDGNGTVKLVFKTPVDAVGAFFGGDGGAKADVVVTFEDGNTFKATRASAGLAVVPNDFSSCQAINGFVGVDSNDGPQITQVTFQEERDIASLDSIFFGTAEGGSHGDGPTLFGEIPNCESNGITLPHGETSTNNDCKHATYSPKKRTLTVPFIEIPIIDFLTGQSNGEVELWTSNLKQVSGITNRFKIISKTLAPITDGSSTSCPATYVIETGTLSIPYVDIPVGIGIGNKKSETDVDVFKAEMTWIPMGKSFVIQEIEKLE